MATDPGMLDQWYQDYLKAQPQAATVTPPPAATTADWTPDANSTVAGQVAKITSAGSPLLDQAETAAKQQMNKRGLLNSSMAITAGQDAVYRTALPIAQQDAGTFAEAGRFNAGAKNTASQFNTGMLFDAGRFNAEASNRASEQQRAAGISSGQMQQQSEIDRGRMQQQADINRAQLQQQYDNQRKMLTAQTDEQLRMLDAQNGTKLADSYRTTSQATYDSYIADVQRIQESDMDPDVKAAQVANLQGLYQTRQEFINTIYRYSPAWSEDWSQFAVEFGEGG